MRRPIAQARHRVRALRPKTAWGVSFGYAVGYVAAMLLGRATVPEGAQLALVWPAAGVGFLWFKTVLIWRGARSPEWVVALASMAALSMLLNALTGLAWSVNLGLSLANVVQSSVAAYVYLRAYGGDLLDSRRALVILLLAATVGSCAGIPFGPAVQVGFGASWSAVPAWVLRNASGIFVVGMLGLRLLRRHPDDLPAARTWHAVGLALATVVVIWVAFWVIPTVPLSFLFVSLGIWVASTRSVPETLVHAIVVSSASILLTLMNIGPYAHQPLAGRAALGQAFSLVLCLACMSIVLGREETARLVNRVRASEAATATQVALLDRIITSMDDGVVVMDAEGQVALANDAAYTLLDWSQDPDQWGVVEEALRPLQEAFEELGVLELAQQGLAPPPVDIMPIRPAGAADRILLARFAPCLLDTSSLVVVVLLDVTEQRRRTAELTSFAGVIAHDLLNPLGAIEGWTEILADEIDRNHPGLGVDPLRRISASASRIRSIISGLMSYSVAREGKLTITQFCLGDVLTEVVEARASAAIAAGLPVPDMTLTPGQQVAADRPLVAQVLDNLIGNAAKYTHPGQRARIEVGIEAPQDGWVSVRVADRGIGLPPGQEKAVFAEFHRVPEHRGAYSGTGLGLSICKRIIERHGGRIEARSRAGGGSEFVFTLPAAGGLHGEESAEALGEVAPVGSTDVVDAVEAQTRTAHGIAQAARAAHAHRHRDHESPREYAHRAREGEDDTASSTAQ